MQLMVGQEMQNISFSSSLIDSPKMITNIFLAPPIKWFDSIYDSSFLTFWLPTFPLHSVMSRRPLPLHLCLYECVHPNDQARFKSSQWWYYWYLLEKAINEWERKRERERHILRHWAAMNGLFQFISIVVALRVGIPYMNAKLSWQIILF